MNNSLTVFNITLIWPINSEDECTDKNMEADVTEWCHNNNMALNVNKKNSFSTPVHPDRFSTLIITNGATAEAVNCLGLLGLQIWNCPSPDPKHQTTFPWKYNTSSFWSVLKITFEILVAALSGITVTSKAVLGNVMRIALLYYSNLNNCITIFMEAKICRYLFIFSLTNSTLGLFHIQIGSACRYFVNSKGKIEAFV